MKTFKVQLTAAELNALEKIRSKKHDVLTVSAAFELALTNHWSSKKYSSSGWRREVVNLWKKHLGPVFGKQLLTEVTAPEVRKWHRSLADTPTAANRALSVLCRLFTYCQEEGLIDSNPCSLVKRYKEHARKRYASAEEIARLGKILERESVNHPAEVAFLYVLMFTGSRPRAIERAAPEDVERIEHQGQVFGILNFKGKSGDEVLVLPPVAMDVLDRLPSPRRTLTGKAMPRALWERAREEAGCPDLWARDWRRTFATLGLSGGISLGIIGEVLNHRSAQTTKIYGKLLDLKRVDAVAAISGRMVELMRG